MDRRHLRQGLPHTHRHKTQPTIEKRKKKNPKNIGNYYRLDGKWTEIINEIKQKQITESL